MSGEMEKRRKFQQQWKSIWKQRKRLVAEEMAEQGIGEEEGIEENEGIEEKEEVSGTMEINLKTEAEVAVSTEEGADE